jgi:general stress protein YciG
MADKNTKGKKGFGAMEENKHREMSRQGGRASAESNTSNRGFASMDKNRQREISSEGGKATQRKGEWKYIGRNEDKLEVNTDPDAPERDLNSLEDEDEIVASRRGLASYSETDEDESEGLGDGNMGRSKDDPF